ncbi:MAG: protein kinase [Pseudomonadota bacterium]
MTRRITLGNYELSGVLGRGGSGEVYLAEDTALAREVAFKTLHGSIGNNGTDWRQRFKLEARTLAQLSCANIAGVYALESFDAFDAIVMEYVKGPTLAALSGRLSPAAVIHAGLEIARGLEVAHAANVLHRDLKPANAIAKSDGTVKLIDFGIAQQEGGERLTRQGCLIGTLNYMAPEAFAGAATSPSTDVYGLAATLYELVDGEAPFAECSETELLRAKMKGQAPRRLKSTVGAGLRDLIEDGLRPDPKQRIATISDFRNRLEQLGASRGREELVSAISRAPAHQPAPLTHALAVAMGGVSSKSGISAKLSQRLKRALERGQAVLASVSDDMALIASGSALAVAFSLVAGLVVFQAGADAGPDQSQQRSQAVSVIASAGEESPSERLSRFLNTPVSQPTFHEPRIAYDGPREVEHPRPIDPADEEIASPAPSPVAQTPSPPRPVSPAPVVVKAPASPPGGTEASETTPEPTHAMEGLEWTWKDT